MKSSTVVVTSVVACFGVVGFVMLAISIWFRVRCSPWPKPEEDNGGLTCIGIWLILLVPALVFIVISCCVLWWFLFCKRQVAKLPDEAPATL